MRGRSRVSGRPLQPMLVTLPFGLFVCATLFDVSAVVGAPLLFGEVGYWTTVAGLAAMGLTTAVGLIDLWDEPAGQTRSALVRFNLISGGMGAMFLIACLIRNSSSSLLAGIPLLMVELVGLAVGGLGLRYGTALLRYARDAAASGERSPVLDALARQ